MCKIELSNRVEIDSTECDTWRDTDTDAGFSYFSDTFSEELTIPFSEIFEFFREEPVFENIASWIARIESGRDYCRDVYIRMILEI
jgi:hypothetical protein